MPDLVALVQAIVNDTLEGFRTAELGVVTTQHSHEAAADNHNYECDVQLRDSGLELKRVPIATHRVGAVAMPNAGDLVLVQFLNGDINSAVVTGRLHTDQVRSPEAKPAEHVYVCTDDEDSGIRRFYLELPKSNKLTVDDGKLALEMGKTTVTIENDGKVDIVTNDQDVTISDSKGDNALTLEIQPGTVTVKAKSKVVVDAPKIELVDGASEAAVLGDKLKSYLEQLVQSLSSHTHPGQVAGPYPVTPTPPSPSPSPPTPDVLSTKVKTG
jgi:hypothetical protein